MDVRDLWGSMVGENGRQQLCKGAKQRWLLTGTLLPKCRHLTNVIFSLLSLSLPQKEEEEERNDTCFSPPSSSILPSSFVSFPRLASLLLSERIWNVWGRLCGSLNVFLMLDAICNWKFEPWPCGTKLQWTLSWKVSMMDSRFYRQLDLLQQRWQMNPQLLPARIFRAGCGNAPQFIASETIPNYYHCDYFYYHYTVLLPTCNLTIKYGNYS